MRRSERLDALERRERATFWREPALDNLELLTASYITHSFAPHTHEGYAIGVIEAGAERFLYRRQRFDAPSGVVVVINPGENHTGAATSPQGWRYRMFYPAASLVRETARALDDRERDLPFFPSPIIHDPELAQALLGLHHALTERAAPLERDTRLAWTFARLIARHADTRIAPRQPPREPERVRLARAYLADHLAESVTLDGLAQAVGLSPFHLLRVFHEQVGLPPHAYLTQLRVTRAKGLLAQGLPGAEVARATGFSDQSHLTRHFKRIVGVPPGEYAASAAR